MSLSGRKNVVVSSYGAGARPILKYNGGLIIGTAIGIWFVVRRKQPLDELGQAELARGGLDGEQGLGARVQGHVPLWHSLRRVGLSRTGSRG